MGALAAGVVHLCGAASHDVMGRSALELLGQTVQCCTGSGFIEERRAVGLKRHLLGTDLDEGRCACSGQRRHGVAVVEGVAGHDVGMEGDVGTRAVKEGLPEVLEPLDLLGRESTLTACGIAQAVELHGHAVQLGKHGSGVQLVQQLGRVAIQQVEVLHGQTGCRVDTGVLDDHHLGVGRTGGQHAAGERNGGDQVGLRADGGSALDCLHQLPAGSLIRSGLLDVVVHDLVKALGTDRKGGTIRNHESSAAIVRHIHAGEEVLSVG